MLELLSNVWSDPGPIFLALYAAWLAHFAVTFKAKVTATPHTQVVGGFQLPSLATQTGGQESTPLLGDNLEMDRHTQLPARQRLCGWWVCGWPVLLFVGASLVLLLLFLVGPVFRVVCQVVFLVTSLLALLLVSHVTVCPREGVPLSAYLSDVFLYVPQSPAEAVCSVGSASCVLLWMWLRWATLQDICASALVVLLVVVVDIYTKKNADRMVVVSVAYDVFWTFVSPLLFHKSVMESVSGVGGAGGSGSGGGSGSSAWGANVLPITLVLDFRGYESVLGLGDVCMPAFFLSFLYFDYRIHYTYTRALGSYVCALLVAALVSMEFSHPQPALMYVGPALMFAAWT